MRPTIPALGLAIAAGGLAAVSLLGGTAPAPATSSSAPHAAHSQASFSLTDMDQTERDAFGKEVRAYLLSHPEVIFEAAEEMQRREAAAQAQSDVELARNNEDALFNDPTSWVTGNPDGDIRIVEFIDYKCGYCKRAHPRMAQLLEDDGNIRLTVKEYPILSEQSAEAARFALATRLIAGDEAYGQVRETLMSLPGNVALTPEILGALALELGLDDTAILEAAHSDEVTEIIAQNQALGQRLQISGTPTFIFEDQMLRGAVELEVMEQVVADLRAAR